MPQNRYLSTDPNAGKLPAAPITPSVEPSLTDVAKDMGIGAVKSVGQSGLDLTNLMGRMNPARIMALPATWPMEMTGQSPFAQSAGRQQQAETLLTPTNRAQSTGKIATDIASTLIPGAMAVKGLRGARAAEAVAPSFAKTSALPANATAQAVADWLAKNSGAIKAAGTAAVPAATPSSSSVIPTVRNFIAQSVKYGVGGAVADKIRRLLLDQP